MKKLLKPIIFFLFFLFTTLVLLPKENIYYLLEKNLKNYNIILSDEKIVEKLFGLHLKGIQLYSNEIHLANIDNTNIYTNIFYTKISIDKLKIEDTFKNFLPLNFSDIYFTHSIINPLNGIITAKSDIGEIEGIYKIDQNKISFILIPKKNIAYKYKNMLRKFKTNDGNYSYEFKF